jgi:cobalt-zinc-cadmium efflux system protein
MHDHAPTGSPGKLGWVLLITFAFMGAEFVAAFWTGSLALLADAGHMLRDSAGLIIAFIAQKLAQRPADSVVTYGYRRFEVLGAFINGLLLFGLIIFITYDAIQRFITPEAIDGFWVLVFGVLGLIVNLIGILLLRKDAKASINMRGAYLEVLADALGSVGVILSGLIIMLTQWAYADGVIALGIAIWMVPRTWTLMKDATVILLEASPPSIDTEQLRAALEALPQVKGVHDDHVWSLTENRHLLSVHLQTDPLEADAYLSLLEQARQIALDNGIDHITVQIEPGEFDDAQPY